MAELVFSLKFYPQIKRTRPDVFARIEKSITESAKSFGAKIRYERRLLVVSFDENALSFAIDVLLLVEHINVELKASDADIYGWQAVILPNDNCENAPRLLRSFPVEESANYNFWCHPDIKPALEQFMEFSVPLKFSETEKEKLPEANYSAEGYCGLISIKPPQITAERFPLTKRIIPLLEEKKYSNCLIISQPFTGKASSLECFARNIQEDFPPLILRFEKECAGLSGFQAAFNAEIQGLFAKNIAASDIQYLNSLCGILERRFLCFEISTFLAEKAAEFFEEFLKNYTKTAKRNDKKPVIIIENIDNAEPHAVDIFFNSYNAWGSGSVILGTSATKEIAPSWKGIFKHIFSINQGENIPQARVLPELPAALWEAAYLLCLFRKCFPPNQIETLFQETEKGVMFMERAFAMLSDLGIIRSKEDAKILFDNFEKTAESAVGNRASFIKEIASGRLIAWVKDGRIKASFDLICLLYELGKKLDNRLLLDSIINDVTNGTFGCVMRNIESGNFVNVTGENCAAPLLNIFYSLKALMFGDEKEVKTVFDSFENRRDNSKIQIQLYEAEEYSISAIYKLGINDKQSALEDAKKSVLLSQNDPKTDSLSRVYRVMSLVNLLNGRLSDAMDYISFAEDNAEKNSNHDEVALNAYYASGAHYLFGNISKAGRLIEIAKKSAIISGRMEWFTRIEFFNGRLHYETGDYEKASSTFDLLKQRISGRANTDCYKTISAWLYRSQIHLKKNILLDDAAFLEETADNLDFKLFEIEALYFAGDYENAVKKADAFIENIPGQSFQFVEQPDWSSGFAGIEFMLFDKKNFLARIAQAYRSISACALNKNNAEEARRVMEHLMRNERLTGSDPNDPFFFYAYYNILHEAEAPEVDKNTAISMAFKRLQSRASRIDDLYTKRAFLSRPYWNNILYKKAIEHKLI